jgi:DNA transformation protein and related proteins
MKDTGSLRSSASFERFVLDQLSDLGEVTSRKMFGGVGLYSDGVFFGIIARDALYLKVDERTRGAYERAGMLPFAPFPGRQTTMRYYGVPVEVLESGMELTRWARDAVKVAMRARAGRGVGSA